MHFFVSFVGKHSHNAYKVSEFYCRVLLKGHSKFTVNTHKAEYFCTPRAGTMDFKEELYIGYDSSYCFSDV